MPTPNQMGAMPKSTNTPTTSFRKWSDQSCPDDWNPPKHEHTNRKWSELSRWVQCPKARAHQPRVKWSELSRWAECPKVWTHQPGVKWSELSRWLESAKAWTHQQEMIRAVKMDGMFKSMNTPTESEVIRAVQMGGIPQSMNTPTGNDYNSPDGWYIINHWKCINTLHELISRLLQKTERNEKPPKNSESLLLQPSNVGCSSTLALSTWRSRKLEKIFDWSK